MKDWVYLGVNLGLSVRRQSSIQVETGIETQRRVEPTNTLPLHSVVSVNQQQVVWNEVGAGVT